MTLSRRWVFGSVLVAFAGLLPVGGSVAVAATATSATFSISDGSVHVTPGTYVYPQPAPWPSYVDLVVTDVTPATVTSSITFTISDGTWNPVELGRMTGPTGTTWTVTLSSDTVLTATASGTIPSDTANTFTLDSPGYIAGGVGQVTVTAADSAGIIGSPQRLATVLKLPRVGATDRYATAALMFDGAFGSTATSAIVASGASFPDALSAGYLGSTLSPQTGVLLTDPAQLADADVPVLTNGRITTVYVMGGTTAVSQHVANQIAALHVGGSASGAPLSVVRVQGADRYATNNAADVFNTGGPHDLAVIASGESFPDALSVGAAVYADKLPLVLTAKASLSGSAAATLRTLGITQVVIVGGTDAVSANVESQLKSIGVTVANRLAGPERTETSAEIAAWEVADTTATIAAAGYPGTPGLGFTWSNSSGQVYICTGDNFPDAVAAGPFAGHGGAINTDTFHPGPILLVSTEGELGSSVVGPGVATALAGQAVNVGQITTIGGGAAIGPAQGEAAVGALT